MVSNLKNDDFRRLLATPSVRPAPPPPKKEIIKETISAPVNNSSSHSFTHKQPKKQYHPPREKPKNDEDNIFSESQAKLAEILSKYRDRAMERRKGYGAADDALLRARMTGTYKALPSSASAAASLAEQRRMEIQESKYLGGDMEHTHLVRGLDYSLLNKVRKEMDKKEDDELEETFKETEKKPVKKDVSEITSNNIIARNINRILFQEKKPTRNELFARGRMAYIVELDDEEEDVPSTLMRSVLDCPSEQSNDNINANNELNNKLAQVLGYLRTDTKKRKKGDIESAKATTAEEIKKQKIFDDVDDYIPSKSSSLRTQRRDRDERTQNSSSTKSYFDVPASTRNESSSSRNNRREVEQRLSNRDSRDYNRSNNESKSNSDYNKSSQRQSESTSRSYQEKNREEKKRRRLDEGDDDAYSELYPSGIGMLDAVGGESDEEADFSKMDMGNRKGPIKRWDFDTQKDFESYQESREAMPKAAYQYGVKMNGGRKTRKNAAAANEKKLDREMEQINKIWEERKKKGDQRY